MTEIMEDTHHWPKKGMKRHLFRIKGTMERHGECHSYRENGLTWSSGFYFYNYPFGQMRDYDVDGEMVRQRFFYYGRELNNFPFLDEKPKSIRPRCQRYEF